MRTEYEFDLLKKIYGRHEPTKFILYIKTSMILLLMNLRKIGKRGALIEEFCLPWDNFTSKGQKIIVA